MHAIKLQDDPEGVYLMNGTRIPREFATITPDGVLDITPTVEKLRRAGLDFTARCVLQRLAWEKDHRALEFVAKWGGPGEPLRIHRAGCPSVEDGAEVIRAEGAYYVGRMVGILGGASEVCPCCRVIDPPSRADE